MTHHLAVPAEIEFEEEFVAGLTKVFEEMIVFNQVLVLKITSLKSTQVRARLYMTPDLVGHFRYNRPHGCVISAGLAALGARPRRAALGARRTADAPRPGQVRTEAGGVGDPRLYAHDPPRGGVQPISRPVRLAEVLVGGLVRAHRALQSYWPASRLSPPSPPWIDRHMAPIGRDNGA